VITLPRRSVTRFFVPLIDVLILLFCMFLLMPFVSQPGQLGNPAGHEGEGKKSDDPAKLERELLETKEELRKTLAKLRRGGVAENLAVRVLEIDRNNGELYYLDPDRKNVTDRQAAQFVIDKHTRQAGTRDPFFLILFPRELSNYPHKEQVEKYGRWFADAKVQYGFDNPLATAVAP